MNSGKIEAEKILLKNLFSNNFWFIIPSYQRPYVWQEDNVNELLDDLFYAFKNKEKNEYFLGSLVLKKRNDKEYEVLDGQQRLTTFTILIACLRDQINEINYKKHLQNFLYESGNPLDRIEGKSKLYTEIRSEVQSFIEKYIISEEGTSKIEKKEEAKNISIKNMIIAIETIKKHLEKYESEKLEGFARFLNSNIMFIYVSTDNTEDAYRLFTILNNRGVPLTTADILKSLNLEETPNSKKEEFAKFWEELEESYGEKFDRFLNFIRTILIKEKARANLLEEFEQNIYKKEKCILNPGLETMEYLKRFDSYYDLLINLNDKDSKLSNEYKNLVAIMKIGFNSEEWIPPLLYYFHKFKYEGLDEFIKLLDNKFMGDLINRETPTFRLESMNNILKRIQKADKNYKEIIQNQEIFNYNKSDFKNKISNNIYGERYCKYILLKLEYLQRENSIAHLQGYNNISVEHILPQNPKENSKWNKIFSETEKEFWTHKLANLLLISKRKNSTLSNLDFIEKKNKYLDGRIDIFHSSKIYLDQIKEWNLKTLEERQEKLIELLTKDI